jgi:hypothetical protein
MTNNIENNDIKQLNNEKQLDNILNNFRKIKFSIDKLIMIDMCFKYTMIDLFIDNENYFIKDWDKLPYFELSKKINELLKNEETEQTVKNEETEQTVKNEETEQTVKNEETEQTVKNEETEQTVKNEETEQTVKKKINKNPKTKPKPLLPSQIGDKKKAADYKGETHEGSPDHMFISTRKKNNTWFWKEL